MNKLVIIGNGFDLAHGLKTSYKDFILWCLRKAYETRKTNQFSINIDDTDDLVVISVKNGRRESTLFGGKIYDNIKSIYEFIEYCEIRNLEIKYKNAFIEKIVNDSMNKWVDIETAYFNELVELYKQYETKNYSLDNELSELNLSFYLLKNGLTEYLTSLKKINENNELKKTLMDVSEDHYIPLEEIMILNFNYTTTIDQYLDSFQAKKCEVKYIHGKLNDSINPIIFGYGDETDEYYEKIENLKNNDFLKHMKSFGYLQTPNYKELFNFLDQENLPEHAKRKFDIYIMGHSCGASDRLLFTHIFEHPLMNSVKLYYYERPDGTNDFYEKTQELSRHFRKDAKHKMRKCIIPFDKSKPITQSKSLTKFKPQN